MTPSQQVIAHMKNLGDEAAAQFYGKTPSAIRTAINTKNISGKLIDKYYASLDNAEQFTDVPKPVVNATYTNNALDSDEVHGKLNDLHGRLSGLEKSIQDLIAQIAELTAASAARSVGGNSAIRPQGEAYGQQQVPQPARPFDAPVVVQGGAARDIGMAPSMQEARRTNQGAKGPPAQPAQPRILTPGEPGQWGWNDTKEQRKAKADLAFERAKQQIVR